MRLVIDKNYIKDIRHLNHNTQIQAAEALEKLMAASNFTGIPHFKSLKGHPHFYRIRIGDYRIGLYWDGIVFYAQSIGKRGDFYKTYPPK
jgi:mRNA interferase RelE/StbE